jgi:uncharacterized membrane protein YhaH (DUF805 family)
VKEVSPIEWAVLPLKKYAVFSGRAPRAEYWWFYLLTVVVQIPLTIVDQGLAEWGPLSSLFSLATFIPSLAVTVRRLHDTNRSGWWLAAILVPLLVIGIAAVGALGSMGGEASAPAGSALVVLIVSLVAFIILGITMLVFMVTEGTGGPNDYGPDPYGPDNLESVFA